MEVAEREEISWVGGRGVPESEKTMITVLSGKFLQNPESF